MDKKLDTLYELCETVSKELETANEKIRNAGGEVSGGDIEFLDRLTDIMKNLKTTIAMMEDEMLEEGNSGYYGGRYYYDGNMSIENNRGSYARGRSNARGGSYNRGGSYARGERGNSYNRGSYARGGRGYSRDDSREDFMYEIEELMEKAPDEKTRMKFERMLEEMK